MNPIQELFAQLNNICCLHLDFISVHKFHNLQKYTAQYCINMLQCYIIISSWSSIYHKKHCARSLGLALAYVLLALTIKHSVTAEKVLNWGLKHFFAKNIFQDWDFFFLDESNQQCSLNTAHIRVLCNVFQYINNDIHIAQLCVELCSPSIRNTESFKTPQVMAGKTTLLGMRP